MNAIVAELKELGQDYQWYPTTSKMTDCIKADMIQYFSTYEDLKTVLSCVDVLDCGAGDGRAVESLANGGKKYAIEKSTRLIDRMPGDVFIVGTEFFQTTLIDKKVDVLFCNPPYSEFETWAQKIISEANTKIIYLILPTRWKNSTLIKHSLDKRGKTGEIIGSFDFLDAERSARAKVDIIKIKLIRGSGCNRYKDSDPFDFWFEENFKVSNTDAATNGDRKESRAKTLKETLEKQLVAGRGVVDILVDLYNDEMNFLQKMFFTICDLDSDILRELNVSSDNIKEALKQRIIGLKNKYWNELFDNYDKISRRLTHESRKRIFDKLTENTTIDFTESNIYAVTVWVIKNANKYYDSQLINLVEDMIDKANVTLYKSNKRVLTDQDWRYCHHPNNLSHFGLELRIILHNKGGIFDGGFSSWDYTKGLSKRSHDFLDNIITIANNLGFGLPSWVNSQHIDEEWESNKKHDFYLNKTENKLLMTVKAFKNGNIHIKFNQDFIRTLNVEFGRLKKWLHNATHAAEELNIPVKQTEKLFKANFQLTQTTGLLQIGFEKI